MSPITKIRVARGVSKPVDPKDPASEWVKVMYELEAVPSPGEIPDQVKDYLEETITRWLGEMPVEEIKAIPTIDIEAFPWKKRDKTPAKPGDWGWIFGPESVVGPPEGSEPLILLLDKHDGKVELPPYEITYSKDRAFIQRRPVKK